MKKLVGLMLFLPALWMGCSNDDDEWKTDPDHLVTPEFAEASIGTDNPYTGTLMVTPAQGNSSIYYGNYDSKGNRTSIHALYVISKGSIWTSNFPIRLPIGNYTFVYWGIPQNTSADSTYSRVAINDPSYVMGTDMRNMSYRLRPYGASDTTYYPVFNYVYSVQPMKVGTDKMSATLRRVTAGFKITLTAANSQPINESIASVRVLLGSIASTLNYYTAEPSDFTKTVSFPLTRSADGMQMSTNSTVMVFPSAPDPVLTLVLTLRNGKQKIYRQTLTNTLSTGTRLSLTASIGDIYVEETDSNGFEISNWKEETETIHFPDN